MIWKIVVNAGLIYRFISFVSSTIGAVMTRPSKLPTCEETKICLDYIEKMLNVGLIDLPGVDESQVAAKIGMMRNNITCSVAASQAAFEKYGTPIDQMGYGDISFEREKQS